MLSRYIIIYEVIKMYKFKCECGWHEIFFVYTIYVEGTLTFRKKIRGSKSDPEKIGLQLAKDMIKAGAVEILQAIYNERKEA